MAGTEWSRFRNGTTNFTLKQHGVNLLTLTLRGRTFIYILLRIDNDFLQEWEPNNAVGWCQADKQTRGRKGVENRGTNFLPSFFSLPKFFSDRWIFFYKV